MDIKEVRRLCNTRLFPITVPAPFDLDGFVKEVAAHRGRPLYLHPSETSGAPCGVWISSDDADHVFYDAHAAPVHRQHIILHELGHVVASHGGTGDARDWARVLMPRLDPGMVSRVLCRTTYNDADEFEAEVFASVVLERAARRPVSPPEDDLVVRRIRTALASEPRNS